MRLQNLEQFSEIVVAGRVIPIYWVEGFCVVTGNMGESAFQPPTITIDAHVPDVMKLEVLMHETLHQVDEAYGGMFSLSGDSMDNENRCKALGIALASIVQQLYASCMQ